MTNENAVPGGDILFEALIVPHRSLTPRGIRILTGSILFLSGILAIRFWVLGAWPVAWFGLIEAGIAIGLVHLNVRQARASELVVGWPGAGANASRRVTRDGDRRCSWRG